MSARDLRAEEGGRVPLFDRLVDLEPHRKEEERPLRILTSDELQGSIRKEVQQILNTRCTTPLEELEARAWTVLDYGLPDYSAWYTRSPESKAQLETLMEQAISAFEPRLEQPRVKLLEGMEGERTLFFEIYGAMRVGQELEPVSFPLALNQE
jgi:type VI secretion system lysozyme-like protein